ncbi:MAG: excalibur calcium-binding domain-containing protein, partial [Gammaproteobacteria bacterium]|nr:excalibur calcium-binding domain-containing protein [Gammaproteobacteria bacterium]
RLVEEGSAWVRRAYSPDRRLIALEDAARVSRRGLWGLPDPVPPWIWRKGLRRDPSESTFEPPVACGEKTRCKEMGSCEEAIAYLHKCNLREIDGDGDGIPCEKLCRYYR